MSSIRIAVLSLGIASLSLVACASSNDSSASESNLTNNPATSSGGAAAPVDGIAACAGRKSCVNAFVMKTLLTSNLQLTEMFQGETPITHAGEYVIDWMQPQGETFSTLGIEASPLGGGKYKVEIGLGNKDLGENSTESGCHFAFTIDHDKIVEPQVKGMCAG